MPETDIAAQLDLFLTGRMNGTAFRDALTDLHARGESAADIAGLVRYLQARMQEIAAPAETVDCCGTGGDGAHTLNISTASAFVLAACGLPVAKHGNRAASSRAGAADTLEACGIRLEQPRARLEQALAKTHFCFLMAPLHHPDLAQVAEIRRAIPHRTIFNMTGPLLNPARVRRQLIGVGHRDWLPLMAEAAATLGIEGWVVHGGGLDEISLAGPTEGIAVQGGALKAFTLAPADFDLPETPVDTIRGGDAKDNAQALLRLLRGEKGPYRDYVIANSAAALTMAGKAETVRDGGALARDALEQGRALDIFEDYKTLCGSGT